MSGIAAVLGPAGTPAPSRALRRIIGAMSHRGTFAMDRWTDGPVALAQRTSRDGRSGAARALPPGLLVVADGRLDNRTELRAAGLAFDDRHSDADLIARAYGRWGTDAVRRLLGDFAFVLWDGATRRLLCARDPLGIRPLYRRAVGSTWAVASEVGALAALDDERAAPSATALALFALQEYRDSGPSLIEGVEALPPGTLLVVADGSARLRRYWSPIEHATHRQDDQQDFEEQARRVGEVLSAAVSCRLDDQNPTAIELSGGLDSTAVAASAARLATPPPIALHLRFAALPCDETSHATAVARHLGLELCEHEGADPEATRPRFAAEQPDLLYYPTQSCFEPLLAAARRRGVRTVLTGLGGDQLFDETRVECAAALRAGDLRRLARLSGLAKRPLSRDPYRLLVQRALRPLVPEPWRRALRRLRPTPQAALLRRPATEAALALVYDRMRREAAEAGSDVIARRLTEELARFTTAVPLWQSDQLAARTGLEIRHPLLDRRLVELALAMPYRWRARRGVLKSKPVLRHAVAPLVGTELLRRSPAAEFSPLLDRALFVDHHAMVTDLFAGSCRLGDLGVIDVGAVRAAIADRAARHAQRIALLVGLELWLHAGWP